MSDATSLSVRFRERAGVGEHDLTGTVVAISRMPYERPSDLSAEGVVSEWRGTCSTKHMLLVALARERWPDTNPRLWHRVYRVTRELATTRWGLSAAQVVPPEGLVDVHTFAVLTIDGNDVRVDVTFPVSDWDGVHDMVLACGPGDDFAAGDDVLGSKAALVARYCDPMVREPFIASLSSL